MRFNKYITESSGKTSIEEIVVLLWDNCLPYLKDTIKTSEKFTNFMYSGRASSKDYFKGTIRKNRKPKDSDDRVHDILDKSFYKRWGWYARSNVLFTSGSIAQADNYGKTYLIFPIGKYKLLYHPGYADVVDYLEEDIYEVTTERMIDDMKDNLIDVYYERYGSESGEGYWSYDGIGTYEDDMGNATDYVMEHPDEFNLDEDDMPRRYDVEGMLNWEPDVDMDDFRYDYESEIRQSDELINKIHEELETMADQYTDGCKDRTTLHAIKSHHEIMLNCKEYIAVNRKQYGRALEIYFNDGLKEPTEVRLRKWYEKQGKHLPRQLEMWE